MLNILFFCSFSALVVGSIPLWWKAVNRKLAGGKILESRARSGSPFGFIDVILVFFVWLLGQVASLGLAALLLNVDVSNLAELASTKRAWCNVIMNTGQLVAVIIAMGLLFLRYQRTSVFGLQPGNTVRDILVAAIAFVMVIPSILIFQWLLTLLLDYEHSTLEMLAKNADGLTVFAAWFGAVLVAPICEEIFFRGTLQAWLQRWRPGVFAKGDYILMGGWDSNLSDSVKGIDQSVQSPKLDSIMVDSNPGAAPKPDLPAVAGAAGSSWTSDSYWPIVITAALFGLAHAGQGPAPIPLFFFGLALGYLYRRTGSIVPCILLHMALNGFSMFWFTLQIWFG